MTEFRKDLEYWTDELVATNADLGPIMQKLYEPGMHLTPEELFSLRNYLARLGAQIHWLDQTVNHYPKPPKKFWQFWKK